jgi:hypothetical protein
MRLWPVLIVFLAIVLLGTAFMLEMSFVMMLGFPDGATTAYDVAISHAIWVFDRFTVAVAVWLVALSFSSRRRDITRAFFATVAVYAVAVLVVVALDHYYATTLPGPWGG